MSLLETFRSGGVVWPRRSRRLLELLAQFATVLVLIWIASMLLHWHFLRAFGLFVIVLAALMATW